MIGIICTCIATMKVLAALALLGSANAFAPTAFVPDLLTRPAELNAALSARAVLKEKLPSELTGHEYLLHVPGSKKAWLGLGASRIVNHRNDGTYEIIEGGESRRVAAIADDDDEDVFGGLRGLIDPSRPAFFFVSLDLHRPTSDPDLPLITFIQPEVEIACRDGGEGLKVVTDDLELKERIGQCLSSAPNPPRRPADERVQHDYDVGEYACESDADFLKQLTDAVEVLQGVDGKMVMTRAYRKSCEPGLDPFRLFEIYSARESGAAASHYVSFGGGVQSIGCSPENVFEVSEGRLCFDVVAGTRGISADPIEDARWLDELENCPKEHKEHNMALERYERRIGSLCLADSVSRDKYMDVRTLRHVRHLHSRVSGKLLEADCIDLLRGSSPALCSYPAELIPLADPGTEPTRYYGGMLGRMSAADAQDACSFLNLRSVLLKGGELYSQGGVGVIRESIPEQEVLEVHNKLRSLRESVAAWEALSN